MALSNWDVAAWDSDGNPCKGEAKLGDMDFQIYKAEVRMFINDVVIVSESGNSHFSVGSIEIFTKTDYDPARVYLFASKATYNSEDKRFDTERFFAIGCYGYNDAGDFIGVTPEMVADYKDWYNGLDVWADDRKVELKSAKRYNLGDAYFAEKLGADISEVTTDVGKAEPTILSKALDSMKKE